MTMGRSLGSVRPRFFFLFFAVLLLFLLYNVFLTWQQLTSFSKSSSTRSGSTATMPFTIDVITQAPDSKKRVSANDRLNLMTLQQFRAQEVTVKEKDKHMQLLEMQVLYSLYNLTQQTTETRGLVVPLNDKSFSLGLSLILELRSLDVVLPIEIPHCGDLNEKFGATIESRRVQLGHVYMYDACKVAAKENNLFDHRKPIFCKDLAECHDKFRTLDIKILAVIYSRFEELMLVDASTLLLQNPMLLWETDKYQKTGTLFFNDRIGQTNTSLGYRPASRLHITELRHYLSNANVSVFRQLPTIPRNKATLVSDVALPFEPSDILLSSHAWHGRSGHQMDSSLLLWSKKRQPRATAVLASYVSLSKVDRPPFYGDKELFFVACELAETQYTFSDFGVGAAGSDFQNHGEDKSIICGRPAQFYPEKPQDESNASLLFLNSDAIMAYKPKAQPLYFSKARTADAHPDSSNYWELPQDCPFDVTGVAFSEAQVQRVLVRQRFHDIAVEWERNALTSETEGEQTQADDRTITKPDAFVKQMYHGASFSESGAAGTKPVTTNEELEIRMHRTTNGPPVENVTGQPFDVSKEEQEEQGKKMTELESEPDDLQKQEKQLVYTLSQITQRTTRKRGIVIPLYEPIARVGFSLILELRAMGISLPIEVPYCTDLYPQTVNLIQTKTELGEIRAYDVCDLAANAKSATNNSRPVFCDSIDGCHTKFRSFMIKPLAISYSQFEQILMLDADTTFFVNPTVLFSSEKFATTGILLMHDRISHDWCYMAEKVSGKSGLTVEQEYFSKFDVTPFRPLPTLQRPKATVQNQTPAKLYFEPSDFLLSSHSFNVRSGHQVDSSLVIWDKKRQPRATAILASFIAQNDITSPPAYGDKELYFYASELAETQYSFSDHAIGAVGTDFADGGPKNSTLCGDMAQVFPIHQDGVPDDDVPLFYLNSDRILYFMPDVEPVYYMKARPWAHYPGAFGSRRQECPFNITVGRLDESHINHLAERRRFAEQVNAW